MTAGIPFDDSDFGLDDFGADLDLAAPVADGAELLHQVRAAVTRYVAMPSDEATTAVVLWIVATHAIRVLEHATRLCIHSPVKRCGKSRLLEIIEGLVHAPLGTTNISVPALFRVIDKAGDEAPTLILDEADRLLGSARKDEDNADLVALLNNGFRRGSPTWRCVGPSQSPTAFSNFAFAATAGIGRLPDTIEDRAINITMRRRLPGEQVSKFRLRRDLPRMHALRDSTAAWVQQNIEVIEKASQDEVHVPHELEDRAQDAWEPLLAVAVVAGGDWPRLAREAAVMIAKETAENDSETLDIRLIADIKTAFDAMPNTVFLPTTSMLSELRKNEDAPWSEVDFTARRLALRLGKFGVKPRRNTTGTGRGYYRSEFKDTFRRYVASEPSEASDMPSEQEERSDASKSSDGLTRQSEITRQTETAGQDTNLTEQTVLTDTPPPTCS